MEEIDQLIPTNNTVVAAQIDRATGFCKIIPNLYVERDRLPSLPDDEFYHADLIGLTVVDTGGETLGRVKAVLNHGAGDLLEVSGKGMKQPVLLPFTKLAVPTVDLSAGRLVADPPDGLFE